MQGAPWAHWPVFSFTAAPIQRPTAASAIGILHQTKKRNLAHATVAHIYIHSQVQMIVYMGRSRESVMVPGIRVGKVYKGPTLPTIFFHYPNKQAYNNKQQQPLQPNTSTYLHHDLQQAYSLGHRCPRRCLFCCARCHLRSSHQCYRDRCCRSTRYFDRRCFFLSLLWPWYLVH